LQVLLKIFKINGYTERFLWRSHSKIHQITRKYLLLSEIAIATYKLEKMIVYAISYLGVCGAIAVMQNLEDESWGDRHILIRFHINKTAIAQPKDDFDNSYG
jgi:hypothetical protein